MKSAHAYKKDLLLCLPNLLSQEEDVDDDLSDWIGAFDRGGLNKVDNDTSIVYSHGNRALETICFDRSSSVITGY